MNQSTPVIELDVFRGPLDLLLHLIKENDIDINDIPMAMITEQYLNYIHESMAIRLDDIGDYLVMAATLIEIKTKLLLPIEPIADLDTAYEEDDPRLPLVQQLLLYQQYQTIADDLEQLANERSHLHSKEMSDLQCYQEFIPLAPGEVTMDQLIEALSAQYTQFNHRHPAPQQIDKEQVSVGDRMEQILQRLDQTTRLTFKDTLKNFSRKEVIASFLAMLELVRKDQIIFSQESRLGPIYLQAIGGDS